MNRMRGKKMQDGTLVNPLHAESILEAYQRATGDESLPVDVVAVANHNNVKVISATFSDRYSEVSGLIRKDKNGTKIYVNAKDAALRQRFTIAHELGHFVEHMNNGEFEFVDLRADVRSPEEAKANRFASELLMPEKSVRKEHDKLMFPTAEKLSQVFMVSKQAMAIRLRTLKLETYDT